MPGLLYECRCTEKIPATLEIEPWTSITTNNHITDSLELILEGSTGRSLDEQIMQHACERELYVNSCG
jgi:hypothetical protein